MVVPGELGPSLISSDYCLGEMRPTYICVHKDLITETEEKFKNCIKKKQQHQKKNPQTNHDRECFILLLALKTVQRKGSSWKQKLHNDVFLSLNKSYVNKDH